MNAKAKIELVPSPAERLRAAIAAREGYVAEVEAIRAKSNIFAPIEAEVAAAEGELQRILQADASAMQDWASKGAEGSPPEPQHDARDAAIAKVSAARAKLNAAGGAKAVFDADVSAANQNYVKANAAVKAAETEVLGEELMRRARAWQKAAFDYLRAEASYDYVHRHAALAEGGGNYFSDSMQFRKPLTLEEQAALAGAERNRMDAYVAGLLRGENPPD